MQLVYTGKTRHCLLTHDFPASFSIRFTENNWSSTERSIDLFEKIILPYLKKVKKEKEFPKEQHSLGIMDTFKRQDNDILKKICFENRCEIAIVSNNLSNEFQPLNLTINKVIKQQRVLFKTSAMVGSQTKLPIS